MVVSLSVVQGVDLANITKIRIGEWNPGVYYFDDLYFACSDEAEAPTNGAVVIITVAVCTIVAAAVIAVIAVVGKKKKRAVAQENAENLNYELKNDCRFTFCRSAVVFL